MCLEENIWERKYSVLSPLGGEASTLLLMRRDKTQTYFHSPSVPALYYPPPSRVPAGSGQLLFSSTLWNYSSTLAFCSLKQQLLFKNHNWAGRGIRSV